MGIPGKRGGSLPKRTPEEKRATAMAWAGRNKDAVKAQRKAYRQANADKIREANAKWRAENPDKVKANNAAQYANNIERSALSRAINRLANAEREAAYNKEWRIKNADRKRATNSAWREENRAAVNAAMRKWQSHNRHSVRTANAAWKAKNKLKLASYCRNRNALKRGAGGKHNAEDVSRILKLQRGKCAVCKIRLFTGKYHVDHIIPIALGGSNDKRNLQLLCAPCNMSKGAKHPIVFFQSRGMLL